MLQPMNDEEYVFWEIDRRPTINNNNNFNEIITNINNNNYIIDSLFEGPTIPFTQHKIKLILTSTEDSKEEQSCCICMEEREEQTCCICMEETEKTNFIELNCLHKFCGLCIKKTLDTYKKTDTPTCPICRQDIINIKVEINNYQLLKNSHFCL
jgi:hypothetical protein